MCKAYLPVVVLLFAGAINAYAAEYLSQIGEKFKPVPKPLGASPSNMSMNVKSDMKGRLLTPKKGCGYTTVGNNKIVGGKRARKGAFPWMALLAYTDEDPEYFNFLCGGSLITSRHVLSAAHCIDNKLEFVRLGEHVITNNLDGAYQDILVNKALPHHAYKEKDDRNDIAMIYLARDVEFSDRIRPVCLPLDEPILSMNFTGTNPFVAGWGALYENGTTSDVLRQVQITVQENSVCEGAFIREEEMLHENQFDSSVLCAGALSGGKDSCQGDSGGPMMLPLHDKSGKFAFYQIGVVSYGIRCGQKDTPCIYANIPHFADWIRRKLKRHFWSMNRHKNQKSSQLCVECKTHPNVRSPHNLR